jgi:leucyl-tRNA synthetase
MAAVRRMRATSTSARQAADLEKQGVFTGFHVLNPVNGEAVPLWVANFALMSYGTGAVMSVPAHDQRDFEFARKYEIPVKVVIQNEAGDLAGAAMERAYTDPGTMVHSGPFSGRRNTEAMGDIIRWLADEDHGRGTVHYRLRDWLVSRQRYWGAPIPILYCEACGEVPVPLHELPVELPREVEFREGGGNPLAGCEAFVAATCPACGGPARRETDTMDTFVDSSWYFLRYCSPDCEAEPFDGERAAKWMPVDLYVGGIEHATMHLIYCRFFTKVLHDLGFLDVEEPARELFCQGMVCKSAYYCEKCKWLPEEKVRGGEREGDTIVGGTCADCGAPVRGEMTKISKSKLNIVDPDAMIERYGADCVRLYMLSDAPPDQQQVWSDERMQGSWRFLKRLWETVNGLAETIREAPAALPEELDEDARELRRQAHQATHRFTEAVEGGFRFNTGISAVMELLGRLRGAGEVPPPVLKETVENLLILMAPVIPHMAEELWARLGHGKSIFRAAWPAADPTVMKAESVEIPVQVNGKVKDRIAVAPDADAAALEAAALACEKVRAALEGQEIKKVIAVPGRIVNIAVAPSA